MRKQEIFEIVRNPDLPYINHMLQIPVGSETKNVFLQYGFYNHRINAQSMHSHSYTEVHMFIGDSFITVDNVKYELSGSNIVVIPKQCYHFYNLGEKAIHSAFQIVIDAEFEIFNIGDSLLSDFFDNIEKSLKSEDYSNLVPYLSLFCSYFIKVQTPVRVSKITDYAFLINEFFSLRYIYDVKLSDLAASLSVSEKQAHRLVIKHMGNNFSTELTLRRMHAATHLIETTSLSLTEIAEIVGYQTYSGFWKAYKKFKEPEEKQNTANS